MDEDDAMHGMLDLNPDTEMTDAEIDAAVSLTKMKQEDVDNLESAALTLLNLNRVNVPEEVLERAFENADFKNVIENAKLFERYGIIPEIEIVRELTGGVKREREEASEPVSSTRRKIIPKRFDDYVSSSTTQADIKREEDEKKQYAIEERNKRLQNIKTSRRFEGLDYSQLDTVLKELDVCQPRMASVFMEELFPEPARIVWQEAALNCRDIYEPSNPQTQCNNVIGKAKLVDTIVNGTTIERDKCYICGFDFDVNVKGLSPACEHILPIIQAIFFLDLYRGDEKEELVKSPEKLDILRKEYAWAHDCCNEIKSDDSYLVTKLNADKNGYPSWGFGVNQTSRILSKIYNTKEFQSLNITTIQSLITRKGYKKWLEERIEYIKNEKVDSILKYIQSKGNGGVITMIGFGNCVTPSKIDTVFKEVLQIVDKGETDRDVIRKAVKLEYKKDITTKGKKTLKAKNNGKLSTGGKGRSKKSSNRQTSRNHRTK